MKRLIKTIEEVSIAKQCDYRLIITRNFIELKLSPKDSSINETNWVMSNNKPSRLDLIDQLELYEHPIKQNEAQQNEG